uniref:Amino_oxidase domain-containing protein n=1 Tax=Rhabditophanes sp. KR3021 TaxID=114890 RepID=A0AC35UGH1_9BILA
MENIDKNQEKLTKRLVIIGSGPTGLGALHRIHEIISDADSPYNYNVTVIERENVVGGLASSVTDEMGFTWDLGVHVTGASSYPVFMDLLNETISEWYTVERKVKAFFYHIMKNENPLKSYIRYPVQNNFMRLPEDIKMQCLDDLRKLSTEGDVPILNFDQFTDKHFGQTLKRIFFKPYNEKVWTVRLEELNVNWVEGRVPKIDLQELEKEESDRSKNIIKPKKIITFRYPACKGIGGLWIKIASNMAEKNPKTNFLMNKNVSSIDPINKIVKTTSSTSPHEDLEIKYDYLVSTMPITTLGKLTNLCPDINLKHSSVVLVGFGVLKNSKKKFIEKHSWLYFCDNSIIFYRLTFLSNFGLELTPDHTKYWSVLCEIGIKPTDTIDKESIIKKCIVDLQLCGILKDPSKIVDTFFKVLEFGYPIPTIVRNDELRKAKTILEQKDIYSVGRFGSHKYEASNQDHSFEQGREIVQKIVYGTKTSMD